MSATPRLLKRTAAGTGALSNHAIGRAFELATLKFLSRAPFELQGLVRVGGAYDNGVDLRGWWPPSSPETKGQGGPRWGVVVQCKAERSRIGPGVVRELEGVVGSQASRTTTRSSQTTIGILVSLNGFSEEATRRAEASLVPLALVHLAKIQDRDEHKCITSFHNRAMRNKLLPPA